MATPACIESLAGRRSESVPVALAPAFHLAPGGLGLREATELLARRLRHRPRSPEWRRQTGDGACALVRERVAHEGVEDDGDVGRGARDLDRHEGVLGEARVASVAHDDRSGVVRAEDRDFFDRIGHDHGGEPRRAHEDERLGREVDVLLVLDRVDRDGLVAELGELDPYLRRRVVVRPRAHHGPVPSQERELRCRPDPRACRVEDVSHATRQVRELAQELDDIALSGVGEGEGEDVTGHDGSVEGSRGSYVGRRATAIVDVEDPVAHPRDIRAPAVDDRDDAGSTASRVADGVARCAILASVRDRDDEAALAEAIGTKRREADRGDRTHEHVAVTDTGLHEVRDRARCDQRRALTDRVDRREALLEETLAQPNGDHVLPQQELRSEARVDRERSANHVPDRPRRLPRILEEVALGVAAVHGPRRQPRVQELR